MADTKITALAAITTVDPAADVLPIVDISDTSMAASGTTKKITSNQILGAGGTATLASATITGDLTVASNILKVTGGNVGINTASPTNTSGYKTLEIVGTGVNTGGMIRMKSSDASVSSFDFVDNNGRGIFAVSNHNLRLGCNDIEQYRIQPLGIFTWYDGAGGTRMTLNSTGLGIGVSPGSKLTVAAGTDADIGSFRGGSSRRVQIGTSSTAGYLNVDNTSAGLELRVNETARVYIDGSGNVGVGVTSPTYKLQAAVASGADRNIFAAQIAGASNGFEILWNHATTTTRVIINAIPTSAAGLASGTLWNDAGTIKIA
jgi:hypothetical protein